MLRPHGSSGSSYVDCAVHRACVREHLARLPAAAEAGVRRVGLAPQLLDYLDVSFRNATAFSPTDPMPLSRWAKMLMLIQSVISLALAVTVVAPAVNILR
jgi:hypothetical protein